MKARKSLCTTDVNLQQLPEVETLSLSNNTNMNGKTAQLNVNVLN